ncbi:MAG: GTPase Era, partial [Cyclobacteriaceae bacterium]
KMTYWKETVEVDHYIEVSALEGLNIRQLFDKILDLTPVHPPYYPTDSITDKPERFFASEIVREKIFLNYKKEIPYSTEVVITEFKEEEAIIRMRAELYVERQSQKGILIGHKGEALKKVGIEARKDLEDFFQKQVHLETFVKVSKDWRKKDQSLKRFGYKG